MMCETNLVDSFSNHGLIGVLHLLDGIDPDLWRILTRFYTLILHICTDKLCQFQFDIFKNSFFSTTSDFFLWNVGLFSLPCETLLFATWDFSLCHVGLFSWHMGLFSLPRGTFLFAMWDFSLCHVGLFSLPRGTFSRLHGTFSPPRGTSCSDTNQDEQNLKK